MKNRSREIFFRKTFKTNEVKRLSLTALIISKKPNAEALHPFRIVSPSNVYEYEWLTWLKCIRVMKTQSVKNNLPVRSYSETSQNYGKPA